MRETAESGSAQGQYELGRAYHMGRGVMENHVLAYMWASVAYENGYSSAATSRRNAESFLNAHQIAEAQDMARACLASNYRNCN